MTEEAGFSGRCWNNTGPPKPRMHRNSPYLWRCGGDQDQGQTYPVFCQPENRTTPVLLSFDDMAVWLCCLGGNRPGRVSPSLTSSPVPDRMPEPEELVPLFGTPNREVHYLSSVWVPIRLNPAPSSRSIVGFFHSGIGRGSEHSGESRSPGRLDSY